MNRAIETHSMSLHPATGTRSPTSRNWTHRELPTPGCCGYPAEPAGSHLPVSGRGSHLHTLVRNHPGLIKSDMPDDGKLAAPRCVYQHHIVSLSSYLADVPPVDS
jgi:hypothetical protein